MSTSASKTVYFISGANAGIGLGLVKNFLSRDHTVVVASVRNAAAKRALESQITTTHTGNGSSLHLIEADFTTAIPPEEISRLVDAAAGNEAAHIDVLINNAAVCPPLVPATETTADQLRTAFETNAISPLLVYQGLRPRLLKSSSPKLINITSSVGCIADAEPLPGGGYGASKAALNWLTKSIHQQEEGSGMVVIALHPGWVQTRNGFIASDAWGYKAGPPDTVEENVRQMAQLIDGAKREEESGKLLTYSGQVLNW
jgi:NAD(P)-dependent dehydrogenase (short-subunit alcohol dehydrogenase family)